MKWLLIGAGIGGAWAAIIAILAAFNHAAHKLPAGGEPPDSPRSGAGHPLPGLIPPPPTSHPGLVVRLAVVYDCGPGGDRYCGWVWRPGHGWKLQHSCMPPLPTPDQWDTWAASLTQEDT